MPLKKLGKSVRKVKVKNVVRKGKKTVKAGAKAHKKAKVVVRKGRKTAHAIQSMRG